MVRHVTNPGANVYVVGPIVVKVMVRFFPHRVAGGCQPRLANVYGVPYPIGIPRRFVGVTGVRIVIVRLVILTKVATGVSVAVLENSPALFEPYRVRCEVLDQVESHVQSFDCLANDVHVRIHPNAVVPTGHISNVDDAPTAG